jgi:hypothetical protein
MRFVLISPQQAVLAPVSLPFCLFSRYSGRDLALLYDETLHATTLPSGIMDDDRIPRKRVRVFQESEQ